MANEFIVRNGFISRDTSFVEGALNVTTVSATTYQNLPVSGLTQGSNIIITQNNSNYTISASITTGPFGISNSGGTYTYYNTLSSAMSAATAGQTIEMFADVTETSGVTIVFKPGVTLHGNGRTYTHTSVTGNTFNFLTGGTFNFINISIKRNVTTPNSNAYIFGSSSESGFFQVFNLVFQGSYVEYIWSVSVGETKISGPLFNASNMTFDGIRAFANGSGLMFGTGVVQRIINSFIQNTGSGSAFSTSNVTNGSFIEDSYIRTNSGNGVTLNFPNQGDSIRNCTVITTSGVGVAGGTAYDTESFSNTNRAFQGVNCYRCAGSTGTGTVYYQSNAWNSTGLSSSGFVVQPFFTLSSFYNCSFNAVGNVVSSDSIWVTAFYNCSLTTGWSNINGHTLSLGNNVGNIVVNCFLSVTNSSANCIRITSGNRNVKYANNIFAGATTPVNANVTQDITNTQDNQGNILI